MKDTTRDRLLGAGIALLFPLVVEYGIRLFGSCGIGDGCADPFYIVTVIGAVAALVSCRVSVGGLRSGLFFGGLLCIARNYYNNWASLDESSRFWSLCVAFLALVLVALYKSGKLKGMGSRKRRV